ncbi:hypothetical protein BSKO_01735 [Bryopsis sp. KO-2023]|nr:hypothetical protein BSKO_01735 [Bryopsis sp. KO-2023]
MEWSRGKDSQDIQGKAPPGFGGTLGLGGVQDWDLPPPPPPPPPLPTSLTANPQLASIPQSSENQNPWDFIPPGNPLEAGNAQSSTIWGLPSTSSGAHASAGILSKQAREKQQQEGVDWGMRLWDAPNQQFNSWMGGGGVGGGGGGGGGGQGVLISGGIEDFAGYSHNAEVGSHHPESDLDLSGGPSGPINLPPGLIGNEADAGAGGYPCEFASTAILNAAMGATTRPCDAKQDSGDGRGSLLSAWRAGQKIMDHRDEVPQGGGETTLTGFGEVSQQEKSNPWPMVGSQEPAWMGILKKQQGDVGVRAEEGNMGGAGVASIGAGVAWKQPSPNSDAWVHANVGVVERPDAMKGTRLSGDQENRVHGGANTSGCESAAVLDKPVATGLHRGWWSCGEEGFLNERIQKANDQRLNDGEKKLPEILRTPQPDLAKLTKEELLDLFPYSRVMFGAVFLAKRSRDELLKKTPPKHPNIYCGHMTVVYKPGPKSLLKLPIGKSVTLTATSELRDAHCQVLEVVPPDSVKPTGHAPHVTMSIAEGAQPRSAGELVADVVGKGGQKREFKVPIQLTGYVGVRLDNKRTVLSLEELFVLTGVNLRMVRKYLSRILQALRLRGAEVQWGNKTVPRKTAEKDGKVQSSAKMGVSQPQGPNSSKSSHDSQKNGSISGGNASPSTASNTKPKNKKAVAEEPPSEEVGRLVAELTNQFVGLDQHVARQLLMVSEWDLENAKNYLKGKGNEQRQDETQQEESASSEEEAENSGEQESEENCGTPVGHLKGPGILHLPDDVLGRLDSKPEPVPPKRDVPDDMSPGRRRNLQEDLKEQAEDHRHRAWEQERLVKQYSTLARKAQFRGRQAIAQRYEQQSAKAKALHHEYNKKAEELGYEASNLGKVCVHIMDFHTLRVSEALQRCEKVVKHLQQFVDNVGGCLYKLKIITGRGNNSQNQMPVLRPQIMEYLLKEGYCPFLDGNPGVVCVYIEPTGAKTKLNDG